MNAAQLINPSILHASPTDSATEVLERMAVSGQLVWPVVHKSAFIGIISEDQLLDLPDTDILIEDLAPRFENAHIRNYQHFLDVLRCCHINQTEMAAILNEAEEYIGAVHLSDVAKVIAAGYSVQNPGSTLVLSMPERDYSLSQICRLAESNGVKVLQSFIDTDPDSPLNIFLTLKLNLVDPSRVIATFERFGYRIVEQYGQLDAPSIDQDRLDMLLKYLNI